MIEKNGAPEEIRTPDPQIRRQSRFDESNTLFCKTAIPAPTQDQYVTDASAKRQIAVPTAAVWLCQHREELSVPSIPALKQRFGLRNLEAIEAAKQAHVLARRHRHG
ncbi:hypothetical protein RJJ65_15870 [Rhizobium hidalgonense]|uniref:Uncharacterized protein n=1 Tax=Rhizobium hidalgonense TaxID=1538159 RepID=A0AAJ2GVS5_9HYPH|nr:hypothetical protein [Rhizobium hidalgonense]MDR9774114.1 hypothetical protein [Rhizobium hidalgonense]MDR9820605.1 hypothetical protein [Rhizobium hidalgonense]